MSLAPATRQEIIRLLAGSLTIDKTDNLVDRLGVSEDCDPLRGAVTNKERRLRDLFDNLDGQQQLDFIRAALELYPNTYSGELDAALTEGFGYRIVGSKGSYLLLPTDSTPADPAEASDEMASCLQQMGYETAAHHFGQAMENFGLGNWEAANAQLRTTLEAVLEAEVSRSGGSPVVGKGQMVANVDKLASSRMADPLAPDIAEHLKTLVKVCHSDGSHPGVADADEAKFRLVSVSAVVRFLTGC